MNVHAKVSAATLGGAVAQLLLFGFAAAGVVVSAPVSASLTVLAVFVAGYFTTA
jgi:hypothetical protein